MWKVTLKEGFYISVLVQVVRVSEHGLAKISDQWSSSSGPLTLSQDVQQLGLPPQPGELQQRAEPIPTTFCPVHLHRHTAPTGKSFLLHCCIWDNSCVSHNVNSVLSAFLLWLKPEALEVKGVVHSWKHDLFRKLGCLCSSKLQLFLKLVLCDLRKLTNAGFDGYPTTSRMQWASCSQRPLLETASLSHKP